MKLKWTLLMVNANDCTNAVIRSRGEGRKRKLQNEGEPVKQEAFWLAVLSADTNASLICTLW